MPIPCRPRAVFGDANSRDMKQLTNYILSVALVGSFLMFVYLGIWLLASFVAWQVLPVEWFFVRLASVLCYGLAIWMVTAKGPIPFIE